jgi:uncharacterized protein
MKDKLQEDLKTAMKAHDQLRVNTVRGVIAEIKKSEIDSQQPLTEAGVIAIIEREIKKRRDAIEFARKASRAELVTQNETEMKILQSYLGEQLSGEELNSIIAGLIQNGADSIGKVMAALGAQYKGRFDGRCASETVKKLLAP